MLYKSVTIFVLSLALAVSSFPLLVQGGKPAALPENVPALLVKANESYLAKDYDTFRNTLERLHAKRPNNSEYMYQLVIAYALLDMKSEAYNLMLQMQQQGLSYDFTLSDDTMNIRGTQVFGHVNELMTMAGKPVGDSEPVFELPGSVKLPETISWDESRQKFLVGTVAEGQILAVGKDGQVDELLKANAENGMWAILDILVDAPRNRLWVTSAAIPAFSGFDPVDKGRSVLVEFDLKTLELIHRYPVPVDGRPHALGSMTLSPNGDIYIADRALPLIYRKSADADKIQPAFILQELISQRGIAIQPDGRVLYVADREMGIMVVDVAAKRAKLLEVPETLNLGGIDGMYLDQNRLFVIQNGIKPQRVMRLQLNSSGTKVETVSPLAIAQPEFDFPSFGTFEGDDFYYFANSQNMAEEGSQKPVTVLRTPKESGEVLSNPQMEQFLKQQAEKRKQPIQENN